MLIGEIEQKTNIRFKNTVVFETSFNAKDNGGYDCADVFFIGWLYKLNKPEFEKVNKSQYGTGTDFEQDIVECIGNNCYIPTSGNCFIKCIKYLTGKDYTDEFLTFVWTEQQRSNVMTSARVQPFCRKYNIKIGCFEGTRINPTNITQRYTAFKIHNNHFCLIWKSDGISFNQAIKELKDNLKLVDNVLSDEHVESFIIFEYKSKKVQSQLSNTVVHNLETFNTDKAVPYTNCIYRLGKISGKNNRDTIQRENEKCRRDCIVFKGTDSVNEILDYALQLKGESKRNNDKFVKNILYLLAHTGSGFDSYVVSNKSPQWKTVVSLIKNGSRIVSLKIFNGYEDQAEKNTSICSF